MARPRNSVPKLTHHKSSGQALVCYVGQELYLGRYGSSEAQQAYARLVADLAKGIQPKATGSPKKETIVDDVMLAYLNHAKTHYRRPDRGVSREYTEYEAVAATSVVGME